jgi:hypothetical protein
LLVVQALKVVIAQTLFLSKSFAKEAHRILAETLLQRLRRLDGLVAIVHQILLLNT